MGIDAINLCTVKVLKILNLLNEGNNEKHGKQQAQDETKTFSPFFSSHWNKNRKEFIPI